MKSRNQSNRLECHFFAPERQRSTSTLFGREARASAKRKRLASVRLSPLTFHFSLFCFRRAWLVVAYIFFNFAHLAIAQDQSPPAPPVDVYNPLPSGNDGSNQLTPPPASVPLSPGSSKISTDDSGAPIGTIPLTSPPAGIALSSDTSRISTDNVGGLNGANQMTTPPADIGGEPWPATQQLFPANREAANKKWLLRFNFSTGVTYDDNIFITNQNKVADEIFTVSGGFTLGLGDYRNLQENYLLAQYQLTGFFFVHNSQENSPEQALALRTQFRFSKLTLQTQTRYDYLSGVNRQVGNFVNQNLIDNLVRLSYDYSDKTQFFVNFEQITNLYQNFLNSYEYIGRLGGTYQVTPKIQLGGEAVLGTLEQDESPSSNYAQLRLLANYDLTGKLSLRLSAGGEIRHYDSSDGGLTKGTPVFSLGLTYRPFPDTSISLTAYRNINASPSAADEDYTATGFAVQLSQLLFQRVTAGISVGYENDNYQATQTGAAETGRVDNYFFIRPSLTYNFRSWLSASLSYDFRRNASNDSGFTFSDNRITLSLGVNF